MRELENTIHRAVLLSMGAEIAPDAILTTEGESLAQTASDATARKAAELAEAATRALVGRTVADVERELILDTLDHCLGNRTHAAKSSASPSAPCATSSMNILPMASIFPSPAQRVWRCVNH